MKLGSKSVCFLSVIVCMCLSLAVANSAEIDPYPAIKIPIFEGGYNLQKYMDTAKETKSIHYYVRTGYPPAQLLEFYDAFFNGSGWRSSFETCQRNWEGLVDGPRTGVAPVRQLYASWDHPDLKLKAVLWLTYELGKKERQTEVFVKCRLQPKVDQ